jgi:hypothetical protein
MADLTMNLAGLPPSVAHRVMRTIKQEDAAAYALGVLDQIKLKKFYDQMAVPGMNTDIGRQNMVISHGQRLAAYRQYGQKCFADSDFSRFLLKKHPEYQVKDVGTKVQSGWTPQSNG